MYPDANVQKAIKLQLLQQMKTGEYSKCDRLPRETVLSEQLGISRTQLRDALSELETDGFITRRHGVGTIINRHVLEVKNRMDIETEFFDIIRQSGHKPGVSKVTSKSEKADAYVANKLKISVGDDILRVCRVCTADGKPAIYCEDVVDKSLIKEKYEAKDLKMPIFDFLKKHCGVTAYMDLTQLHAVLANERVAQALKIPQNTPLLNMEEVDFDIDGKTVFFSSQYFIDELFEQTVLRKKL